MMPPTQAPLPFPVTWLPQLLLMLKLDQLVLLKKEPNPGNPISMATHLRAIETHFLLLTVTPEVLEDLPDLPLHTKDHRD